MIILFPHLYRLKEIVQGGVEAGHCDRSGGGFRTPRCHHAPKASGIQSPMFAFIAQAAIYTDFHADSRFEMIVGGYSLSFFFLGHTNFQRTEIYTCLYNPFATGRQRIKDVFRITRYGKQSDAEDVFIYSPFSAGINGFTFTEI